MSSIPLMELRGSNPKTAVLKALVRILIYSGNNHSSLKCVLTSLPYKYLQEEEDVHTKLKPNWTKDLS